MKKSQRKTKSKTTPPRSKNTSCPSSSDLAIFSPSVKEVVNKYNKRIAMSPIVRRESVPDAPVTKSDLEALKESLLNGMNTTISTALEKFKTEIQESIKSVENSQQQLRDDFNQFKAKIGNTENNLTVLQTQVGKLNADLNHVQQQLLVNDILIANVPKLANENIPEILSKICTKIGVTLENTDIITANRIFSKNRLGIQPILVKFTNIHAKNSIMEARKSVSLTSKDIVSSNEDLVVYVHHHLTPTNKFLLAKAHEFKKRHQFAFAWFSKGFVYIRKAENSPAIRITSIDILNGVESSLVSS